MRGPKDIAQEAHEEEREAQKPGARGHEYRDRERVGDEGQPFKRGGGMHKKRADGGEIGHPERERGGYMPEETEASEHKRGERTGHTLPHEKPEPKTEEGEGHEEYSDDVEQKKRGGKVKKRARGGGLDAADEHKKHLPHHHPRKRGGKVPGKAAKSRPDRRARGGGTTADLHPMTAAGNMSVPDYERQHDLPKSGGGGQGKDTRGKNGSMRP